MDDWRNKRNEYQKAYQRNRFNTDPEYRAMKRRSNRMQARTRNHTKNDRVNALDNVQNISLFTSLRAVYYGIDKTSVPSLNFKQLGKFLGRYSQSTIKRWISEELIPGPIIKASDTRKDLIKIQPEMVYTTHEAIAIAEVIGREQKLVMRINMHKRGLKDEIFQKVNAVRIERGIKEQGS